MIDSSSKYFKINEMGEGDFPDVHHLWISVGFDLTLSDSFDEVKKMIKFNPGLCLVGRNNQGKLIGAVLGGFDGRRGWIHHLAIDPSYQRKGLGRKIIIELIGRFKLKNVVKLKLEILESNKDVIDFYKKMGWDFRSELVTMSLSLRPNKI